jgi:hypothetical protein
VIVGDYRFSGHETQEKAADQFAESVEAMILSLPTGQELLLKP